MMTPLLRFATGLLLATVVFVFTGAMIAFVLMRFGASEFAQGIYAGAIGSLCGNTVWKVFDRAAKPPTEVRE